MADTEKPAPMPYVPPSKRSPDDITAELSKALEAEGLVKPAESTPAPAPEAPKEAAKETPKEASKEEDIPAIAKIAKKQAEFRKEVEQYKPVLEILNKARNKQITPADALAALGYTHNEYVDSVIGMAAKQKGVEVNEEKEKPAGENPDIRSLREEIQRLKSERDAEKAQTARQQALQGIESAVKKAGDKYRHVAELGEYEAVERVIIQHYNETGELPGENFEQSIALAAEVVENQLKTQAAKWQKVLTTSQPPANVSTQKAPESPPSAGNDAPRALTNSNTTAPAAVRPVPKTRQEIIAALIEGREDELAT